MFAVHLVTETGPILDVRVDAIGIDGVSTTLVTFDDVAPRGWDASEPDFDRLVSIGPDGWLLLGVQRYGGNEAADRATLLLDARAPLAPGLVVPVRRPWFWGPNGTVAWDDGELRWIDPTHRAVEVETVPRPQDLRVVGPAAADGSGWLAGYEDENGNIAEIGVLRPDGEFVPGPPDAFDWTGTSRRLGADGGWLTITSTTGANGSSAAIVEFRSGLGGDCHCIDWAVKSGGADPLFADEAFWDASGRGVWLSMAEADGGQRWLSHRTEPGIDAHVVDLPAGETWQIVGISNDDRFVALSGPRLLLVEVETGALVATDGTFGGWLR